MRSTLSQGALIVVLTVALQACGTDSPANDSLASSTTSPTTSTLTKGPSADPELRLDVVYVPSGYPNIHSIAIRNDGPTLDISGWTLASRGDPTLGFLFPDGATIPEDGSIGVFQQDRKAWNCPEATAVVYFACYDQSSAMFPGRGIVLLNSDLSTAASWDPPVLGGPSDALP